MKSTRARTTVHLAGTPPPCGVVGVCMLLAVLCLASQAIADDRGAFCELSPCVPGPVTRSKLLTTRKVGALTCKPAEEIGVDAKHRVVFCTTDRVADVEGLPVAKDAYTLFHPSGRIYQTHVRSPFVRTLADGATVTCAADLVALHDDGTLQYCTLGAPRVGSPRARVGQGISFHPSGRIASQSLDEPYPVSGLALSAGSTVRWDVRGAVTGGYSSEVVRAGSLSIQYDFALHPNGQLKLATLASSVQIAGHMFPDSATLSFRDDGSLAAAEYIEAHGFMIHGEPWSDKRYTTFDTKGQVLTTRVEHHQATARPPKFRKK